MTKRDSWVAAVAGLITAFFVRVLYVNAHVPDAMLGHGVSLAKALLGTTITPPPIQIGGMSFSINLLFIVLPVVEFVGYVVASFLFSRITVIKQLGRFGIVGLMNFAVDAGILTSLSVWSGITSGVGVVPFNAISVCIAIGNSYVWQRKWTFSESHVSSKNEFFTFLIVTLIGLGINTVIVSLITGLVTPFDGVTAVRLETLAKVAATLVSLIWNFLGYKFIVFR